MRAPSANLSALSRPAGVREVAAAAGVSVATVSRVFNEPESVRENLRNRVRDAALQLHYVPNAGARALSSHKTRRIGALIPTIDNSIFAAVMTSLQRQLAAAGFGLLIGVTEFDDRTEQSELRSMLASGIDGLVLTGARRPQSIYDELESRSLPFVLTSIYLPESRYTSVGYDNVQGGRLLARHLGQLGHRRIAMIAGPCRVNDRAELRRDGVRRELEARGLELPESRVIERSFSFADGRIGLRHLLRSTPRPTAIICGNDVLALGALFEALAAGIKVPEELSIVGFDGLELGQHTSPGLTTVDVHCAEIGSRTAEVMLARLSGQSAPKATRIELDLVVRGSSGPAPIERA